MERPRGERLGMERLRRELKLGIERSRGERLGIERSRGERLGMERPRSVERLGMKRLGGLKAVKLAIERPRG